MIEIQTDEQFDAELTELVTMAGLVLTAAAEAGPERKRTMLRNEFVATVARGEEQLAGGEVADLDQVEGSNDEQA